MDSAACTASDGAVQPGSVSLSPVAWCARQQLSMHEWVAQGRRLGTVARHVGWWIGDWLRYGNAAYGERYARAAKITGYDTQTLMNMVYVASQVDVSRRRESLSWSHHAEVAALADDEQQHWLEHAEARRLSVRDLREEIRRAWREPRLAAGADQAATAAEHADALTCPECGHEFSLGEPRTSRDSSDGHARPAAGQTLGAAA